MSAQEERHLTESEFRQFEKRTEDYQKGNLRHWDSRFDILVEIVEETGRLAEADRERIREELERVREYAQKLSHRQFQVLWLILAPCVGGTLTALFVLLRFLPGASGG